MSQRIIIEYRGGSEWDGFPVCLAATVSSLEAFEEALGEAAEAASVSGAKGNTLYVDGIVMEYFPLNDYLENSKIVDITHLESWFEQQEIENSTPERLNRLCEARHAAS